MKLNIPALLLNCLSVLFTIALAVHAGMLRGAETLPENGDGEVLIAGVVLLGVANIVAIIAIATHNPDLDD